MKRSILVWLGGCALVLAAIAFVARERVEPAPIGALPEAPIVDVARAPSAGASAPASAVALDSARAVLEPIARFRVIDAVGAAIEDATLVLLRDARREELARTALDGHASVALARFERGGELAVSAAGHATAFLDAGAIDAGEREVRLEPGGSIAGLVQRLDGSPAGEGVRVLAVPLETAYSLEPSAAERLRCREARGAVTDLRGSFRIDGLLDGTTYCIQAWRDGSFAIDERVLASRADLALTLRELWGARLVFTCTDEAHLARFYREPELSLEQPRGLDHRPYWRRMLGLVADDWVQRIECERCVTFIYAQRDATGPGQPMVECGATIPGFFPFRTQVEVRPIRDGWIEEHRVELEPDERRAGALEVVLTGASAELAARMGFESSVRLKSESRTPFAYRLSWSGGERVALIASVPVGTYSWTASTGTGEGLSGTEPVEVREAESARIELELPPLAYIEVECRRGGLPAMANILLAHGPGFTGGRTSRIDGRFCRAAREVMGPFPPGRYDLGLAEPFPDPTSAIAIDLEAGELHTAILEMERER